MMAKILLHKNVSGKEFPRYAVIQLLEYSNKPKYTKFKNFLENNVADYSFWPTCGRGVSALEVDKRNVFINSKKCIGCLLCISSQKNLEELNASIIEVLDKILPNFTQLKSTVEKSDIFNGEIIEIPRYNRSSRNLRGFNIFTSEKETKHISLWGCSVLNFLSSDPHSRIGKEVDILRMENPRDGRLDVCVISHNNVIVCETKNSLDALLTENRYRIQVPSYRKECEKVIGDFNFKYGTKRKLQIYLLVGGEETDLFPPNHPKCTSAVGNKSTRFYSNLKRFNIKFISANALWAMMLRSLIKGKRLCWDILFDKIFDEKTLCLLTAGKVVINNEDKYKVVRIPKITLDYSEQAFF